jgi:hypothetical protein
MRAWDSKAIDYSITLCGNWVNGKEKVLEFDSHGKDFTIFLVYIFFSCGAAAQSGPGPPHS